MAAAVVDCYPGLCYAPNQVYDPEHWSTNSSLGLSCRPSPAAQPGRLRADDRPSAAPSQAGYGPDGGTCAPAGRPAPVRAGGPRGWDQGQGERGRHGLQHPDRGRQVHGPLHLSPPAHLHRAPATRWAARPQGDVRPSPRHGLASRGGDGRGECLWPAVHLRSADRHGLRPLQDGAGGRAGAGSGPGWSLGQHERGARAGGGHHLPEP